MFAKKLLARISQEESAGKDEHRTSNVQHRMMNEKANVKQRMMIEEKDEGVR
jgi:hypothetical protein